MTTSESADLVVARQEYSEYPHPLVYRHDDWAGVSTAKSARISAALTDCSLTAQLTQDVVSPMFDLLLCIRQVSR